MSASEDQVEIFNSLLRSPTFEKQRRIRNNLNGAQIPLPVLKSLTFRNAFFQLSEAELAALGASGIEPLSGLVAARHRARTTRPTRAVVFCMPKSGSTFVKTALARALGLPVVSLTSFGNTQLSSMFGMNGREQELDELALVKSALVAPGGFVAQHHTRYTPYLDLQMKAYSLQPIVTVRNIPDALVSFDDMMMAGRAHCGPDVWKSDPPFALPIGYAALDPAERYRIIGASLGVWLVQFHLSWLRGSRNKRNPALTLRYEVDVVDPDRLTERLVQALRLDERQAERLSLYAREPEREQVRFNVGRPGRGADRIPGDVIDNLRSYLRAFADEIPKADVEYLLG